MAQEHPVTYGERRPLQFEQIDTGPIQLTGSNDSGGTNPQVSMTFGSNEAAVVCCNKHGLDYRGVPAARVRMKL